MEKGNGRIVSQYNLYRLLTESIKVERNMAELYGKFSRVCKPDGEFWKTLSEEEMQHYFALEKGKELFEEGRLSPELFFPYIDLLQGLNRNIRGLIERVNSFSRIDLLQIGYELETRSAEEHFYNLMNEEYNHNAPLEGLSELRRRVSEESLGHAERIKNYARSLRIDSGGPYIWDLK